MIGGERWAAPGTPHAVLASELQQQGCAYPKAGAALLLQALQSAGFDVVSVADAEKTDMTGNVR